MADTIKAGSGFVPPAVTTPENTTATNMWAWIYNELQRITTYELNPNRLKAFRFDSGALMPYHATLQTIALMFGEFFEKDFPREKIKLEELFNHFLTNFNKANDYKKGVTPVRYLQDELNNCWKECLQALKLADELLARIRQEKGFGYKENPTFVINDRCAKALSINNNIGKDILKIFKRQKLRKDKIKSNVDKIDAFLHPKKEGELIEEEDITDAVVFEKEDEVVIKKSNVALSKDLVKPDELEVNVEEDINEEELEKELDKGNGFLPAKEVIDPIILSKTVPKKGDE